MTAAEWQGAAYITGMVAGIEFVVIIVMFIIMDPQEAGKEISSEDIKITLDQITMENQK